MDRPAVILQSEVDRSHLLPATGMGAAGYRVDDVRRQQSLPATLTIQVVHPNEFIGIRGRRDGG